MALGFPLLCFFGGGYDGIKKGICPLYIVHVTLKPATTGHNGIFDTNKQV